MTPTNLAERARPALRDTPALVARRRGRGMSMFAITWEERQERIKEARKRIAKAEAKRQAKRDSKRDDAKADAKREARKNGKRR